MKPSKLNWLGMILLAALFATPASVLAFNPQPEPPPGSAAIALGLGQSARVNVVFFPPDPIIPPDPVRVRLVLLNERGGVIARKEVELTPGAIAYLDVPGGEIGRTADGRTPVSAQVQCLGQADQRLYCAASVKGSLEIYNTLGGRTSAVLEIGISPYGATPPDDG